VNSSGGGGAVPDVLAPGLTIVFCGINPGLRSGQSGHHFAHPGNRFWKLLHASGWTPSRVEPADDASLIAYGIGITNLVARTTVSADELSVEELRAGAAVLERKLAALGVGAIAFLGLGAFRQAFGRRGAKLGEQPEPVCRARTWVLPNPSGLQATYSFDAMVALFGELRAGLTEPF
jgi:double-stranded uracil-DNA glycosylase